jgi:hypothetical protein
MNPQAERSTQEVLAGLVERVTYHNAENGFCVLHAKARGHREMVTVVGHAATADVSRSSRQRFCAARWRNPLLPGYATKLLITSPPWGTRCARGHHRPSLPNSELTRSVIGPLSLYWAFAVDTRATWPIEHVAACGAELLFILNKALGYATRIRDSVPAKPHRCASSCV